jgi:nicotinate phosphoribosyltransferase
VPNAIKAFNNVLAPMGKRPVSIRIDSGDITYLSKKARKMLDEAGYPDCSITASNSLDEYIINDMILQGAKVDCFIVGERLINSASAPLFSGVYKLSAVEKDGKIIEGLFSYNEVQYTKDEYIQLMAEENEKLNKELIDTQLALCEVYEMLEGGNTQS